VTVYAIAQISIHDRTRYDSYAARFLPVLAHFGGTLLAADERPEVIEGNWTRQKVILFRFPDRASFDAWAQSPQYQEISRDRLAATDGEVIVIRGLTA
jgi:uncharacterized protein (DUF1330 family)